MNRNDDRNAGGEKKRGKRSASASSPWRQNSKQRRTRASTGSGGGGGDDENEKRSSQNTAEETSCGPRFRRFMTGRRVVGSSLRDDVLKAMVLGDASAFGSPANNWNDKTSEQEKRPFMLGLVSCQPFDEDKENEESTNETEKKRSNWTEFQVVDSVHTAKAWVRNRDYNDRLHRHQPNQLLVVSVRGYITSKANAAVDAPLLCITEWEFIATQTRMEGKGIADFCNEKKSIAFSNDENKVMGGGSAAFLHAFLPYLSNDDLVGLSKQWCSSKDDLFQLNRDIVQEYMTHHKAMKALQHSTAQLCYFQCNNPVGQCIDQGDDDSDGSDARVASSRDPPLITQREGAEEQEKQQRKQTNTYFGALAEFSTTQMHRPTASLIFNDGSSPAVKVAEQYEKALEMVLAESCHPWSASAALKSNSTNAIDFLTARTIQSWHRVLCGNGVRSRPGSFRAGAVEEGTTTIGNSQQVESTLKEKLLPAWTTISQRFATSISSERAYDNTNADADACVGMASIVFFGLVDLHPFRDGNVRCAGLASNYALQQLGLPFCMNWFDAPVEQKEYINAVLLTQRNMSLVHYGIGGKSDDDEKRRQRKSTLLLEAMRASGLFRPLVYLLMDRVRRAFQEFWRRQQRKWVIVRDQEEAQTARRVRERVATGQCIICLDEKPNIATLCCGKAVHLNCIAEWLSSKHSCPQCRAELPLCQRRPAEVNHDGSIGADAEAFDDLDDDDLLDHSEEEEGEGWAFEVEDEDGATTYQVAPRLHLRPRVPRVVAAAAAAVADRDDTTMATAVGAEGGGSLEDDMVQIALSLSAAEYRAQNAAPNVARDEEEEEEEDTSGDEEEDEEESTTRRVDSVAPRIGLRPRVVAADTAAVADRDDTDSSSDEDERTDARPGRARRPAAEDPASDESTTDTIDLQRSRQRRQGFDECGHAECGNRAAQYCTNGFCGRCCGVRGTRQCSRHAGR